jgi:hypothetical protein
MNSNDACYGRGKLRNKMELKSLAAMLCCARDKCRGKLMLCSLLVQMFIVSANFHYYCKRPGLCDTLTYQNGAGDYSSVLG